nr:DNA cytosine methyltransferase [Mesorhizobium sp. B2-1-2]
MSAYALYNEINEYAADWLENLIKRGLIAPGIVDRRSIEDLRGDDLRGFRQVHFFAGIGVWSYALRAAGWPDERRVWTGSCPCQPHSTAASERAKGFDDPRDLWPTWLELIRSQRPDTVFGEQVDDSPAWIDRAATDLERERVMPSGLSIFRLSPAERPTNECELTLWPTPTVQDAANRAGPSQWVRNSWALNVQAVAHFLGTTERPENLDELGALNPEFACWLMGLPPEWDACAPTATRSSAKPQRHSSKPISKQNAALTIWLLAA